MVARASEGQKHLHSLQVWLRQPLEGAVQVVAPAWQDKRRPDLLAPLQRPQLLQTPAGVVPAVARVARRLTCRRLPLLQGSQMLPLQQQRQAAEAPAAAPSWQDPPNLLLLLRLAEVGPAVAPGACLLLLRFREGAEGEAARAVLHLCQACWPLPDWVQKQYSIARQLGQQQSAWGRQSTPAALQLLPPPQRCGVLGPQPAPVCRLTLLSRRERRAPARPQTRGACGCWADPAAVPGPAPAAAAEPVAAAEPTAGEAVPWRGPLQRLQG